MPQLILGVNSTPHDASAAIFDGYSLKAAVSLEGLTRQKGDGTIYPDAAIDEVLDVVGATRRDVDACAYNRGLFPARYFRRLTPRIIAPAAI
jgi:carbamoyltransferase